MLLFVQHLPDAYLAGWQSTQETQCQSAKQVNRPICVRLSVLVVFVFVLNGVSFFPFLLAGYNIVVVETVGLGQSEIDVDLAVDMVIQSACPFMYEVANVVLR